MIDSRLGAEVAVPHSYLLECEVADRCTVGPFAYLRPKAELAEGAKAGTFVEIKNSTDRRRHEGPAPLLHRRRRRRGGRQPRRRDDHRQLRRLRQEPDKDRARCEDRRRHDADRARRDRRFRLHWRRFGDQRGRPPGRPRHRPGRADQHRGLRRAQGQGKREQQVSELGKMMTLNHPPSDQDEPDPAPGQLDRPGLPQAADGLRRPRLRRARRQDRQPARRRPRPGRPPHLLQRRGLLPLPGVDPRRRRLHRPVDRRQRRAPG